MSYFDMINFEGSTLLDYRNKDKTSCINNKSYKNIFFNECTHIHNCDVFITKQMIEECFGSADLVHSSAILEGAKLDLLVTNFMKEGEDYKGLKSELKKVIDANNLNDKELSENTKIGELNNACKRVLQICCDVLLFPMAAHTGTRMAYPIKLIKMFGLGSSGTTLLINAIIDFVILFMVNRLFRLMVDQIEFQTVKQDAKKTVSYLRDKASEASDEKVSNKLNSEADRLEKAIEKYSKKRY